MVGAGDGDAPVEGGDAGQQDGDVGVGFEAADDGLVEIFITDVRVRRDAVASVFHRGSLANRLN